MVIAVLFVYTELRGKCFWDLSFNTVAILVLRICALPHVG